MLWRFGLTGSWATSKGRLGKMLRRSRRQGWEKCFIQPREGWNFTLAQFMLIKLNPARNLPSAIKQQWWSSCKFAAWWSRCGTRSSLTLARASWWMASWTSGGWGCLGFNCASWFQNHVFLGCGRYQNHVLLGCGVWLPESDVVFKFHIAKPWVSTYIDIFGTQKLNSKNHLFLQKPKYCDVESWNRITIWLSDSGLGFALLSMISGKSW